jgi:hypothetical protein
MKSALDEQGFTAKNFKENRLVAWEEREREEMQRILERHGLTRDVKNANYAHQTVEEYKETQDIKKYRQLYAPKKLSPEELTERNVRQLQLENSLLKTEKEKMAVEKLSPYKSFYYSAPDKQSFVQSQLDSLKIPYRETENGFEAQECYVLEIRKVEKQYKPVVSPHRNNLRDDLDRFVMQSKTFDELLERLKNAGYEMKQEKYLAVKPKYGVQFIRLKSLGEDYSEQALRNRLVNKQRFEAGLEHKIGSAKDKDTLGVSMLKTVRHYTVVFAQGVLPVRKLHPKKPFTWTNDAELDKLSALNRKINAGATLDSLRNEFAAQEKAVAEKIAGGTYVQSLIEQERLRRQAEWLPNGVRGV